MAWFKESGYDEDYYDNYENNDDDNDKNDYESAYIETLSEDDICPDCGATLQYYSDDNEVFGNPYGEPIPYCPHCK